MVLPRWTCTNSNAKPNPNSKSDAKPSAGANSDPFAHAQSSTTML